MNMLVKLAGRVEKVIFRSASGFSVVSLSVSSREAVTIQGVMPDVLSGESISVHGVWEVHAKFGRQFKVETYSKELPADSVGIQKYLSSGLIKGIGPSFAQKLVDHFGSQTLQIIDTDPDRLREVAGVGEKRVDAIVAAWQEQKEVANVMVFLKARDVSTAFAAKIFKLYGKRSIQVITDNPYRLMEDVWGVGFKTADDLAIKLGLEPISISRAKAGILHVLSDAMGEGSTVVQHQQLIERAIELLEYSEEQKTLLESAIQDLDVLQKIKKVSKNNAIYFALSQCFFAERRIANKIQWLLKSKSKKSDFDHAQLYQELKNAGSGVVLNEDQQKGILACFENKVSVITGGPGTGKTTLVRKLLDLLDRQKLHFKLAAPTGRAAKRMFEGTGRSTETLHRMLEFDPAGNGFKRNNDNTLELDWLIVDEASMIDVFLLSSIVDALPSHAHLVLIGDVDQLPSVGPGSVLKDLISSAVVNVSQLKEIFRQAQDSMIVVNAHKINHGIYPSARGEKHDFFVLNRKEPAECIDSIKSIFKTTLPKIGVDAKDAIVLTPMNRGTIGTARINEELQMLLNSDSSLPSIMRFGTVFRKNDRVMQIKNNYTKFIFNGDIGSIDSIDLENQRVTVLYGEKLIEYEFHELNELVLAYAISIHKSQGSEFKAVVIPLMMQHFVMLQRNLVYTAVTRAKQLCIIVGDPRSLAMAVSNNKEQTRETLLKDFLTSDQVHVSSGPLII
ncbi:ATP-dependent RecD-like DNA helicase [Candidatus Dependentiae bacterium]|nr:ATP-dependent RecD-like DNA helicase [Candidatus Dependentiae bacterium]